MDLFQEKIVSVVALFPKGVFLRTLEPGIVAPTAHARNFTEWTDEVLQEESVDYLISIRWCQSVRFVPLELLDFF